MERAGVTGVLGAAQLIPSCPRRPRLSCHPAHSPLWPPSPSMAADDGKVAVPKDGPSVVSWVPEEGEKLDQEGKDQVKDRSPRVLILPQSRSDVIAGERSWVPSGRGRDKIPEVLVCQPLFTLSPAVFLLLHTIKMQSPAYQLRDSKFLNDVSVYLYDTVMKQKS